MTNEILKYIFNLIVDKEMLYSGYATPWIAEDGRIYATDGKILLCLESKGDWAKAVEDNGSSHHPNVAGMVPPFGTDESFKGKYYVKLDALESFTGYCDLGGIKIKDKKARKIAKILRLFGMEAVCFDSMVARRHLIAFNIAEIGVILCADEKKADTVLPFQETHKTMSYSDAWIDWEKGKEYYKKCLMQDKAEQEEYDKENFTVYKVTLIRSRTICVKAENEREARDIALNNAYNIDFDDCEVEDCKKSRRDDVCELYDDFYTQKGKEKWEQN